MIIAIYTVNLYTYTRIYLFTQLNYILIRIFDFRSSYPKRYILAYIGIRLSLLLL